MMETQMRFLETINKAMPMMTELEQEKLLAFGEGLAFMTRERLCGAPDAERAQGSA